jgi:hypothetical protein
VTMNGLPTTDVVDMGNNYVLRAQRVVIQQWKEDVPWAKKGQVTFGLGGTIALEAGLLPGAAGDAELMYASKDKKFQISYPYNWHPVNQAGADIALRSNAVDEGGVPAMMVVQTGDAADGPTVEQMVAIMNSDAGRKSMSSTVGANYQFGTAVLATFGDTKALKLPFTATGPENLRLKGTMYMFFSGETMYALTAAASESSFAKHEAQFEIIAGSFKVVP